MTRTLFQYDSQALKRLLPSCWPPGLFNACLTLARGKLYHSSSSASFLPSSRAQKWGKSLRAFLALLEKPTRVALKLRKSKPQHARKLVWVFYAAMMPIEGPECVRPEHFISAVVRFRGICLYWRDAGLEHLPDAALIKL